MDQDLDFTRPTSVSIQGILNPILGGVAQFVFWRNDKCGTFVRMTFNELVRVDVYFEPAEGWKVALYKVTKKGEINKQFGYHQELLLPKFKNIAHGGVVVAELLPVLEKYLATSPLNRQLTPEQVLDVQEKIANYKQAKVEQKVRSEMKHQQQVRDAPSSKGKATTALWIALALVAAAILGSSGSGSSDCDFYPDPRGGFTDCS